MTTPEVYGLGVGAGTGLGLSILLLCCLKCLGFGSRGVRSDSYAAIRQSNIGNVESGSCFACKLKNISNLESVLGQSRQGNPILSLFYIF